MNGVTHGIMVGGVSSAISAAWIRREVLSQYRSSQSPVSLRERLTDRAPLAIAGLAYTGLSAYASLKFDKAEMQYLADGNSEYPAHQQIGNHRKRHSLPYIGGAVLSAYLLRHGSGKVGRWVASRLDITERVVHIIDSLENIADFVITSLGSGAVGHLLGDIPTSSPLHLLKPFSDRNLALNIITNKNPTIRNYLQTAGWALAGGSWSIAGLYLLCRTPPDVRIRSFAERLAKQTSIDSMIQTVKEDITNLFPSMTSLSRNTFWNSDLFQDSRTKSSNQIEELPWAGMKFDADFIWGINDITFETLKQTDILPSHYTSTLHAHPDNVSSLYQQDIDEVTFWDQADADSFWETTNQPSFWEEDAGASYWSKSDEARSLFE